MVAMDHLDYSLKQANLKGKNIQNILRQKVEPMPPQIQAREDSFLASGLCGRAQGAMIAGDINRVENQAVNQICWTKAVSYARQRWNEQMILGLKNMLQK